MLMILPPPAAFIRGWTAFEHRNALVRLVLMTLSHSSSSRRCGGLRTLIPALLTRISMRPNSRAVRSVIAATAALSVTSVGIEIARTPQVLRSAIAEDDLA